MPPLSDKTQIADYHLMLAEVNDFGEPDMGKRVNGTLRMAKTRVRRSSRMGLTTTLEVTVDSNHFEMPPTFTIEMNLEGPRVYVHGIAGELAVIVTVLDDGSIKVERV